MAVVNLDDPSDVAAWNCRAPAPASQPAAVPVGMQPAVWRWETHNGHAYSDSHDDGEGGEPLYTAAQVQAMLTAAPRNAPLYDPDDVAFPIQRSADGVDALSPELASTARPASIAAVEVAAPSVPARAPHDHIEDVRAMVQIAVEADEVLLALKRPEGYEDVHPELVAADALSSTPFDYRVAWPLEVEP